MDWLFSTYATTLSVMCMRNWNQLIGISNMTSTTNRSLIWLVKWLSCQYVNNTDTVQMLLLHFFQGDLIQLKCFYGTEGVDGVTIVRKLMSLLVQFENVVTKYCTHHLPKLYEHPSIHVHNSNSPVNRYLDVLLALLTACSDSLPKTLSKRSFCVCFPQQRSKYKYWLRKCSLVHCREGSAHVTRCVCHFLRTIPEWICHLACHLLRRRLLWKHYRKIFNKMYVL